jgi:hypothetical protein
MNWERFFSEYLSPIGGIGMFVATLILLILTAKYLKFTKDMAKIMKEDFEIKIKPIIEIYFAGRQGNWASMMWQFSFRIFNRGSCSIFLSSYNIKYWSEAFADQIFALPEKKANRYISPNEHAEIKPKLVLSELNSSKVEEIRNKGIMVEFNFEFFDARGTKFTEKIKREIKT